MMVAIGSIQRALKDDQALVRVTAEGVLAILHQAGAWERLRESAAAANPEARGTALRMLGETKDRRGLPTLKEALSDTQPSVRGAAATGLGEFGALGRDCPADRGSSAIPFLRSGPRPSWLSARSRRAMPRRC